MEFQFRTRECMEIVSCSYPCRAELIRRLFVDINLGREHPCALPASVYIYGDHGTGKTAVLTEFLAQLPHRIVTIDCVECFTPKIIYETILNELFEHRLTAATNFASYARCDNGRDFVDALHALPTNCGYVLRFDDAQRLREMDASCLAVLLRLRSLCRLNVCCLFVSTLPFEKLLPTGSYPLPVTMHWPNYTQREVLTILLGQYPLYSKRLHERYVYVGGRSTAGAAELARRADLIDGLERGFYENYLQLFLNIFHRTCRELNELRMVSLECFVKYCEPVLMSGVAASDVRVLYKNIAGTLRTATNTIYRRIDRCDAPPTGSDDAAQQTTTGAAAPQLELPYFAKYLLIAAFLASHNDVKLDKRLFVKHHGKQRKTQHTINAKQIVSEKMATQLGPKSFPIDRLLAIFYAIVEERVPLTCNLLAQIPSLVRLRLLNFVSGEANVMDGTARLQCIVNLEFILHIGKNVGFNVRQYLGDFI